MNRLGTSLLALWAGLTILSCTSLLPTASLCGQQLDQDEWSRGYNGFALICRSLKLTPAESFKNWRRTPADESVLVIFGSTRSLPINPILFAKAGGNVLIASDKTSGPIGDAVFRRGWWRVRDNEDAFEGAFGDCPVIQSFSDHPVVNGIDSVVANRSGALQLPRGSDYQVIATLPRLAGIRGTRHFLIASPDGARSREVYCPDQSAFSNQMLYYHDNAKLALQTMNWLKADTRTNLLILVNGIAVTPPDPDQVAVEIPSPSKEEILNNLKNLPPDKLLQFGNAMATLIEDENLVNEFLAASTEQVSDKKYFRSILFLLTFLLSGFLFYRYMASESLLQDATGIQASAGVQPVSKSRRRTAARNRHAAARELVNRFYQRVSDDGKNSSATFPENLKLHNVANASADWRQMKKIGRQLRRKRSGWWSADRLRALQSQLDYWTHLYENGQLANIGKEIAPAVTGSGDSTPHDRQNP